MPGSLHPASMALAVHFGDDGLVLGQRLSEWCGHAPSLELDLALANIGLDLLGQADHFLAIAGVREGAGRDADKLAFHRDVLDFQNCLLVEQPNGDFARTIARQFLFSAWQEQALQHLAQSADPDIAAIANKAVKEVTYHARFAGDWMVRLGDGTQESRRRVVEGLDWCWRFVDELFLTDTDEIGPDGAGLDRATLRPAFDARVEAVLADAGLDRPAERRPITGGRQGRHTEHLGPLLAEMQFLPRAYPDAVW